jgi:hypothetical protein
MGVGAIIFADPATSQKSTCYEARDFAAYKTHAQGITGFDAGKIVQYRNLTMIDTVLGSGAQISTAGDLQYQDTLMTVMDSTFYGESEIPDCPHKDADGCFYYDKQAIWPGSATMRGKPPHIDMTSALPMYKIKGDAAWTGLSKYARNTFIGWKARTHMDRKMAIYGLNHEQSDYIPRADAPDNKFIDVEDDALFYFMSPKEKWANVKDCGDFPCTAPNNVLISHTGSKWEGKKPATMKHLSEFQLIANNSGLAPHIESCMGYPNMNGYICEAKSLSVLQFESNDEDWMDRSCQPVFLNQQGSGINNKLNSQMDHVWDGFYAGQLRQSRFPGVINAVKGSTYDITYTGTPPKKQRFEIFAADSTADVVIRIAYPEAQAYQVEADGKRVEMNAWDDNI